MAYLEKKKKKEELRQFLVSSSGCLPSIHSPQLMLNPIFVYISFPSPAPGGTLISKAISTWHSCDGIG